MTQGVWNATSAFASGSTKVASLLFSFFFNDTATTEIYTLSLHDALPISTPRPRVHDDPRRRDGALPAPGRRRRVLLDRRSEEHTSELQSQSNPVCRLLLEKIQPIFYHNVAFLSCCSSATIHTKIRCRIRL